MAINESVSASTPSAEAFPAGATSDVIVGPVVPENGRIFLQAKAPGGEWADVCTNTGAYSVSTPDAAIAYRFRPSNVTTPVHVYFGA